MKPDGDRHGQNTISKCYFNSGRVERGSNLDVGDLKYINRPVQILVKVGEQ